MRWIALAQCMAFDPDTIEVFFSDQRFTISKMLPMLKAELARHGGEFGLVIIDTGPSLFEGDDENTGSLRLDPKLLDDRPPSVGSGFPQGI
jgi:hypothetical protein